MATHYNIESDSKVELLSVRAILITKPIAKVLKDADVNVKSSTSAKMDPSGAPFPLSKLDNMRKMFEEGATLPPITVSRYKTTDYFSLIDGRHRFVMSIITGYSHVPVVYQ